MLKGGICPYHFVVLSLSAFLGVLPILCCVTSSQQPVCDWCPQTFVKIPNVSSVSEDFKIEGTLFEQCVEKYIHFITTVFQDRFSFLLPVKIKFHDGWMVLCVYTCTSETAGYPIVLTCNRKISGTSIHARAGKTLLLALVSGDYSVNEPPESPNFLANEKAFNKLCIGTWQDLHGLSISR